MELSQAVAENVKYLRRQRKLSMERAAALAGVSRSMLGQIERGEANPSVAILGRLAAALKVPAAELMRCDDFTPLRLYRELDKKPVRMDAGKVVLRPSVSYEMLPGLESAFLDVYISGCYEPEPAVAGCLCTVTVLSGTVSVAVGEEVYPLLERDALRLAADGVWAIRNAGNAVARLYLLWQYRKVGEE